MIEFDYTLLVVSLGSAILGAVSGVLGSFAVLRCQSLLGDVISHAALPGIVLGFVLTGSKSPIALMLGAAASGWIAALCVMAIVRGSRVKSDGALGIVLASFFGLGLVLLTQVQKTPNAAQAGLDKFLFGQAAALLEEDLWAMGVLGGAAVAICLLFWKEFKLITFDVDFAASLGFATRRLEVALTALLVIAIVIGLQTVGVVLMSAMVVAPAAAARQWTRSLGSMVALSALFGVIAGVGGAIVSASTTGLPTGPTIVMLLTLLVIASLFLSPSRGLLWRAARRRRKPV